MIAALSYTVLLSSLGWDLGTNIAANKVYGGTLKDCIFLDMVGMVLLTCIFAPLIVLSL